MNSVSLVKVVKLSVLQRFQCAGKHKMVKSKSTKAKTIKKLKSVEKSSSQLSSHISPSPPKRKKYISSSSDEESVIKVDPPPPPKKVKPTDKSNDGDNGN